MKRRHVIALFALCAIAASIALWAYAAKRERHLMFEHSWTRWRAEDVYRASGALTNADQERTLTPVELSRVVAQLRPTPPDMADADHEFARGTFILHPAPSVLPQLDVVAIWLPSKGARLPAVGVLGGGGTVNLDGYKREFDQWTRARALGSNTPTTRAAEAQGAGV